MKNISLVLLIISAVVLIGCSNTSSPVGTKKIDIEELIKSPTTVQIDSTTFTLSVYLWRDFMPISPIDGKPMLAVVSITTIDSSDFPTHIDADKFWVIDSANVWEAQLIDDPNSYLDYKIAKKASDGPKWETGILVDAVVRLIENDSVYHYLKVEDIEITRTD